MDDNILKINGKSLSFKESDIKLFRKLKNSIEEVERTLRESGKIPDWKRKEFIANMTEGYLSVMIVLHDVPTSSLDVGTSFCSQSDKCFAHSRAEPPYRVCHGRSCSQDSAPDGLGDHDTVQSSCVVSHQATKAPERRNHLCLEKDSALLGRTEEGSERSRKLSCRDCDILIASGGEYPYLD